MPAHAGFVAAARYGGLWGASICDDLEGSFSCSIWAHVLGLSWSPPPISPPPLRPPPPLPPLPNTRIRTPHSSCAPCAAPPQAPVASSLNSWHLPPRGPSRAPSPPQPSPPASPGPAPPPAAPSPSAAAAATPPAPGGQGGTRKRGKRKGRKEKGRGRRSRGRRCTAGRWRGCHAHRRCRRRSVDRV